MQNKFYVIIQNAAEAIGPFNTITAAKKAAEKDYQFHKTSTNYIIVKMNSKGRFSEKIQKMSWNDF